jgi:hypothetical protein
VTTAIILDARLPVAHDLASALTNEGFSVIAADTYRAALSAHRHAGTRTAIVPSSRFDRAGCAAAVDALGDGASVVVAAMESALHLAFAGSIQSRLFAPDGPTGLALHNRGRFRSFLREAGIRAPSFEVAADLEDVARCAAQWGTVLVQPVCSRAGEHTVLVDPQNGRDHEPSAFGPAPYLVQRIVTGRSESSLSVVADGRVTAHVAYIAERSADGTETVRAINPEPSLPAARAVARFARYGFIGLDHLRDPDGSLWTLECNPRPTRGMPLIPAREIATSIAGTATRDTVVIEPGSAHRTTGTRLRSITKGWKPIDDIVWNDPVEPEPATGEHRAGSGASSLHGVPTTATDRIGA